MTTDLARTEQRMIAPLDDDAAAGALAHVLGTGDLYQMSNSERVAHYVNLCRSRGFNPLTRPYQWIEFKESENGPAVLTLYLKPDGAAQILTINHVSVHKIRAEVVGELFVVEVEGTTPKGRRMSASKYVPLVNRYGKLPPRLLANALMSAETGAYRRLAIAMFGGAGGPDADEVHGWRSVTVDGTGAVLGDPTDQQKYLAEHPRAAKAIGEPVYEDADVPESDLPHQRPTLADLEPPKRDPNAPRPSFRMSDDDVAAYQRAYFAIVNQTSLATDDGRAIHVGDYTEGIWPKSKRTNSLATFLRRATRDEIEAFLLHTRSVVVVERDELLEDARAHESDDDLAGEVDETEPF